MGRFQGHRSPQRQQGANRPDEILGLELGGAIQDPSLRVT